MYTQIEIIDINIHTEMFDGLETHSVLYVLHHSTPLVCLNPTEVIQLWDYKIHSILIQHFPGFSWYNCHKIHCPFMT